MGTNLKSMLKPTVVGESQTLHFWSGIWVVDYLDKVVEAIAAGIDIES